MRLHEVIYVDFRKSDYTLFRDWEKLNASVRLKPDEVICMISYSRNLVMFVSPMLKIDPGDGRAERKVIASQKVRIIGGACDLRMLANWADAVGIKLDGIKRYEEYWGYLDVFDESRREERAMKADKPMKVTTTGRLTRKKGKRPQVRLVQAAARRSR